MNDSSNTPQPNQNLPVPVQQTTAIARPAGGRNPPPQSWQSGEPEAVPWGQYLDALRRRWWVIVIIAVGGAFLGKQYSRSVPSEFTATTRIFVSSVNRGGGGPITSPTMLTPVTLQDLAKDPFLVAPVVRELRLNVHYKSADAAFFKNFTYDSVFTGGNYRYALDSTGRGYVLTRMGTPPTLERGGLEDSVGRTFGFKWQPPGSSLKPKQIVEFSVNDVLGTAYGLAGKLQTGFPEDGGQILTLTLRTDDRWTIAPTLNAWAKHFIDHATELKRKFLTDRRDLVEQQLVRARSGMDNAQHALEKFRQENVFAPTEGFAGNVTLVNQVAQLAQTKKDLDRVKEVLKDNIARPGQIDEVRLYGSTVLVTSSPRLVAALGALATAEGQRNALRSTLSDSNPQVIRANAQIAFLADTTVRGLLEEMVTNFSETATTLDSTVNARRFEISQIPRRTFQDRDLQLQADAAVKLWTQVSDMTAQVRLADEQNTADLQIMGDAIPPGGPSSSRGPRLFILAVAASVGAGLAVALLLDKLDRRFRYPQQATMELGLTIAGTIPFFKPNRKGELNLTASAQVVESFRTLRLSTQFHFPPGEPVVVCISSPGPGEGKSLVASNLAVAFANAGQKTLLIDGDVRRGVVHTTFESERRPGLVDYLGGTATPAQIVRPTSTDHLFIVPSGSRSRRAPELLVSDRMAALVAEMRAQYEVIIIDSAPFVAGMDAFALGAAAGTMLVVLRPGHTDRKLAENKLEILDRLPVTIIGAVLNAISGGRAYRYYSDYTAYEGTEDDFDEADFDQAAPPPTSPTRLIGPR